MSNIADENAAELKLGEDFAKTRCLWNSEVRIILEHHLRQSEEENSNTEIISQTLKYVQKFNNYDNPPAIKRAKQVFEEPLRTQRIHDFEVAALNNLQVDTAEEAYSLIPSLKEKYPNEEELDSLLERAKMFQK